MDLLGYSDSEDSDNDAPQVATLPAKSANAPASKPSFQKVVDRSNPGKIKLSLPSASRPQGEKDGVDSDAPPAKRPRVGGSAFGGFNAMLPAPKKPKLDAAAGGSISGKRGLGKGLGVGVNLKTGAEPAFQRRPAEEEDYDEDGTPIAKPNRGGDGTPLQKEDFRAMFNLPPPKVQPSAVSKPVPPVVAQEVPSGTPDVKVATRPKFMPLSVARGKKKKPGMPRSAAAVPEKPKSDSTSTPPGTVHTLESQGVAKPPAKPRISLFSVGQDDGHAQPTHTSTSNDQYQPLLYGVDEGNDESSQVGASDTSGQPNLVPSSHASSSAPHGLTGLASDLNLSEREKRQLFGRKGRGPDLSGANFIDFNTDQEYAHNEKLRQQGETVQHNALKSITGTGKNSLRSLVNVATTQKDALEEHFASGRRNKREAGNKYGW